MYIIVSLLPQPIPLLTLAHISACTKDDNHTNTACFPGQFNCLRKQLLTSLTPENMCISICVCLKDRSRLQFDGRQFQLFPNCVDSLLKASSGRHCELLVADFESNDWPLSDWLPNRTANCLDLTIIKCNDPFSRGKGRNIAASYAKYDILLFLDADMLVSSELLSLTQYYIDEHTVFAPIPTDLRIDGLPAMPRDDGYGAIAIQNRIFKRSSKWPEFHSWGGEDTIYYNTLRNNFQLIRHVVPGFFHQWHPEGEWKYRYDLNPPSSDFLACLNATPT